MKDTAPRDARTIVYEILREIESRVYDAPVDEADLKLLQKNQQRIEDAVILDFSRGVPPKYLDSIKSMLGNDVLESLGGGKRYPLARKSKDRIQHTLQKLSVLIEQLRYYKNLVQKGAHKIACLEKIKNELANSQIAHVQEVEIFEHELQDARLLISLVLMPFEDAMRNIMSRLTAKQLDVFLFDDDKFLGAELKIDGHRFIYNIDDVAPSLPEAVSTVTYQEIQETSLDVPLIVEQEQIGHYRVLRQITDDFDKNTWKKQVEQITPVLARIIESNRNRILARKVYIDELTQMYNKRKLNEQMGKMFKQFKQATKELHIVMIDIDRFKVLNDTYGHPVGDKILKQTALIIKEEVPYAYRYGGEEFAAVFYGYGKDQTIENVERLRKRIEKTPFDCDGKILSITISAGIAAFETHMNSVMDAVDHADQALYASKEDGRNRCTCFDDVKDRLSDDAAKLRQEILKLQEEVKRLSRFKRGTKKTGGYIKNNT